MASRQDHRQPRCVGDPVSPWRLSGHRQPHGQTDRRTDRQTAEDLLSALLQICPPSRTLSYSSYSTYFQPMAAGKTNKTNIQKGNILIIDRHFASIIVQLLSTLLNANCYMVYRDLTVVQ